MPNSQTKIQNILEIKEKMIKDYENKECNQDVNDALKFYSDNGLIACMEMTEDESYLILGNENLGKLF